MIFFSRVYNIKKFIAIHMSNMWNMFILEYNDYLQTGVINQITGIIYIAVRQVSIMKSKYAVLYNELSEDM